jgi:LacI family transcriptional regulator
MITLKILAETLGVSVSTVSKALKDSPEISKDTIARVKEVATQLNYKPNRLALGLKNRKTRTIGVIIPNILNHFFAKVLYGIEQESTKRGYNIITCISNESYEKERESLELLANGSVDGYIMSIAEETQKMDETKHFKEAMDENLPIVMFDRVANNVTCDKVVIDDFGAAFSATTVLLEEGRKNIVLINTLEEISVGKLRILGHTNALEKHSGYAGKPVIVNISKALEPLEHEIEKVLKTNKHIDALLCIDNITGTIAIGVAQRLGIKVPEQLSIIGFSSDNMVHLTSPKLSTVSQYGEEIGVESVNLLIDRIENNDKSMHIIKTINFALNLRGTTKPQITK